MHSSQDILNASFKNARQMVRENLQESDAWLCRAVVAIMEQQTLEEQNRESTDHNNGVGFNGSDARLMTSFGKQIVRWISGDRRYNQPLSPRQLARARERMDKYAGQLVRLARAKAASREMVAA